MTTTSLEQIKARYVELVGEVPKGIQERFDIAEQVNRINAIIAIEELRNELIHNNSLDPKVQQLVHFGQLLAMLKLESAELHAKAAKKAGASLEELLGVTETALITAGMPSYAGGIGILHRLFISPQT